MNITVCFDDFRNISGDGIPSEEIAPRPRLTPRLVWWQGWRCSMDRVGWSIFHSLLRMAKLMKTALDSGGPTHFKRNPPG